MTQEVRCPNCNKKVCEATEESVLNVLCTRCKTPFTYSKGKYLETKATV